MAARNWLIGCGIGCGAVALLCVASVVGFVVWVTRPGELLEPERLLGPSTTGYVECTLRLEDPGTEGFIEEAFGKIQDLQQRADEPLPGWLRRLRAMQEKRNIEKFRGLFPVAAVWTLQPGTEPGEDVHQLSFSFEKLGNRIVFFDWLIGWMFARDPKARVHEHAGEDIYQLPIGPDRPLTFFVRGNDVFFCSDLDSAIRTVDRLREAASGSARTDLTAMLAEAPADRALRGAIVNDAEGERFDRLLGALPGAGWSGVRGLTVAGGLQADGSFRARVELIGPDPAWASAHAGAVADAVGDRVGREFEVEVTGQAAGERVIVDVVLDDVLGALEKAA